jgi:hypothetical protein
LDETEGKTSKYSATVAAAHAADFAPESSTIHRKLLEGSRHCLYAATVDPKALLSELLRACRMLGLAVRDEPMKVPATRLAGGLVRLRGMAVVIVDSSAPVVDRVAAIADAFCELAVDPLHLSSDARRAISLARARRRRMRHCLRMRRREPTSEWKVSPPQGSGPSVRRVPTTGDRE